MKYVYCLITLWLFACNGKKAATEKKSSPLAVLIPDLTLQRNDRFLVRNNGKWFYRSQPFGGTIETYDDAGTLRTRQSFYEGIEEGCLHTYYANGHPDAERYYHAGEKDSVNKGWWPNGRLRFEYHFRMGVYEGDFKEWYASGKPLKHIYYQDGKERWGRGWRENGKSYMSFEVRDGRVYGSINPNLCYSLRNEQGGYIAVRK
jgi:antitoxin component YwqK of YwqJK toxin-antitoxin module